MIKVIVNGASIVKCTTFQRKCLQHGESIHVIVIPCAQVWRPSSGPSTDPVTTYTLVSQTFVHPTQLRDVDIHLDPEQYIRVRQGDVLGLHHPRFNPVGWSAVPCAVVDRQGYRVAVASASGPAVVGRPVHFRSAPVDDPAPCRHYSFAAVFGTLMFLLEMASAFLNFLGSHNALRFPFCRTLSVAIGAEKPVSADKKAAF